MLEGVDPKVRIAPTFPVAEYIANNSDVLDANFFAVMRNEGLVEEFPECNGFRRLAVAGG